MSNVRLGGDPPETNESAPQTDRKVKEAKRLFTASAALARSAGLPGIEATDVSGEAILLALIGEKAEALRLGRGSVSAGQIFVGDADR